MADNMMQALMMTAIKKHELVEVPVPHIDAPDDVILKVRSVGVCGSDLHGYAGHTGRRIPPLIMGHEVTGEVVEVGREVTDLQVGDRVAVEPVQFCGHCPQCLAGQRSVCENRQLMGMNKPGAYAEYVKWSAVGLHRLPERLSYEHGALAEPLSIAVHAVGLAHIKPYDTAFIVGAGPIGLLTLGVLRQTGVNTIIMSDTSDVRLEFAQSMGANVVINPKRDHLREVVNEYTDGSGVDVAFEAVGMGVTSQQTIEATRNRGSIIWIGNSHKMIEIDMQAVVTRELTVLGSYGMTNAEFKRSLALLADGAIPSDQLINRRVTLDIGETLFDELLAQPEVIKCMINFSES